MNRNSLWYVTLLTFSMYPELGCCFFRGEDVVSTATTEGNQAMLSLKKVGANVYAVSVMSLEYVETVLRLAGDKKLLEVRSCLEGIIMFLKNQTSKKNVVILLKFEQCCFTLE